MDKLLMQKPEQLKDERNEMFALMDRFSASIKDFQIEYAELIRKYKSDINLREQQKNQVLLALLEKQKNEKNNFEAAHSSRLRILNKRIEELKNESLRKLDDFEKKCREGINNEQAILNGQKRSDDERIKNYKDIISEINNILKRVDIVLGTTVNGESKFDKICKNLTVEAVIINNSKTAVDFVAKHVIATSNGLLQTICEITESLPKKIIFNKKRSKAIKSLLEIQKNAENALLVIEKEVLDNKASCRKSFEQKSHVLREECNRNKQSVIERRDNNLKRIGAEIDQENNEYSNDLKELAARHKQDYEKQYNYFKEQIGTAENKWLLEGQRRKKQFWIDMEEQYPSGKMNSWINQFWYHPKKIEDYSKICNKTNFNVLLGLAQVDITDWVSGPTGQVVYNVLKRYITLFGRNSEQANKEYESKSNSIYLPYLISIESGDSILLSHDEASGDRAKNILNGIAMRLMNSVSACMMRFLLFDAGGYGSFSPLKSLDPANVINPSEPTVKSIIYNEGRKQSEMSTLISELSDSLSGIEGQMNKYASIREFNEKNPLSKQIYKPLLMANYPNGLIEDDIKTLTKLVTDCSKWGCSLFLAEPDHLAESFKPEFLHFKNELDKKLINLRVDNGHKYLSVINANSDTEKKSKILMYGLPDTDILEKIIAPDIRIRSVEASRILINLSDAKDIFVERNDWFKEKADDGIVVPIGYLEGGKPFNLQFDDSYVNSMIMGQTGSGKTNLLHAFLMGILTRYDPSEVKIFLIDFKKGLDFNIYTKYYLPSFAAIGINSDPEFALAMLQTLEKEMVRRKKIMDTNSAKKIADSNSINPDDKLCRILFIVDELYVLAEKADDDLRKKILKKIDEFTHQGRAFGIHTIVCGQDLENIDYYDTIKEQCKIRLALHCGDNQVKDLLDESAVAKMHSIDENDQGACVFSINNGLNPHIERTVFVEDTKQKQMLKEISDYYLAQKRNERTKILHSNIGDNPNHPLQLFISHGIVPNMNMNLAIGDPISMDRSINLRPNGHIWIAGGYGTEDAYDAAQSVLFFLLYSMLLNKLDDNKMDIFCSNCADQPTRSVDDEEKDLFGQLASSFDSFFDYDRGNDVQKTLSHICEEMDKRKCNQSKYSRALWWFIVRPETIPDLFDNRSFIIDFKELLANGAKYNIHVILWNYDVKLAQKMQIERNQFKDRICLQMSPEDLRVVNGSDLSLAPNGYKASIIGSSTMRFRVFDLPDGLWMNQLFNRLGTLIHK